MKEKLRYAVLALVLVLLPAIDARADRVVLVNGNILEGTIVRETKNIVFLLLEEGMKMRLPRSQIREISREALPEPPKTPPVEPKPVEPKPTTPKPRPDPEPAPTRVPAGDPGLATARSEGLAEKLFKVSPGTAWDGAFSRYPVLGGSRTVGFRAYEYVGHEPIARPIRDPDLKAALLNHGHAGNLCRWDFVYVGVREFRFGDSVKLVAEITEPQDQQLIRLSKGPLARAPRLQVLLVKRDFTVKCYATPTGFTAKDFRREGLEALDSRALPVRVFPSSLATGRTVWLQPDQSRILEELYSRFGDSVGTKLERLLYRRRWFEMPEHERPALDLERLRRNDPIPLAAKGTKAASEAEVMTFWGGASKNLQRLSTLCDLTLRRLGKMGVRPGDSYYVERDAVTGNGPFGVTLRTHRSLIPARLLSMLEAGR